MSNAVKDFKLPIAMTAAGSFIGGFIAWIASSPVWIGALIGAVIPIAFFVGAMMAVYGLIQIVAEYLGRDSR